MRTAVLKCVSPPKNDVVSLIPSVKPAIRLIRMVKFCSQKLWRVFFSIGQSVSVGR